jgi:hypothetical protein
MDVTIGRRKVAALAAGAVAAAGITAGAVAATTNGSGQEAADLAAAINKRAGTSITAGDVTGAFQDLLKERLDAAVKAGKLTQAQADQMLQRAKDAPAGLPGPFGGPGFERGEHHVFHGEVLDGVAKKLGLTEAQLRAKWKPGTSLAAVAKAQGVTRAELLATITAALKADGVPASRASDVAAHIADDTGPPKVREFHGGPGWGPPPGVPNP